MLLQLAAVPLISAAFALLGPGQITAVSILAGLLRFRQHLWALIFFKAVSALGLHRPIFYDFFYKKMLVTFQNPIAFPFAFV